MEAMMNTMMIKRRALMKGAAALGAASWLAPATTFAQSDKPLRVIVGFGAGVSIDVVSRIVAVKLPAGIDSTPLSAPPSGTAPALS